MKECNTPKVDRIRNEDIKTEIEENREKLKEVLKRTDEISTPIQVVAYRLCDRKEVEKKK
jgi:hypothetical protein